MKKKLKDNDGSKNSEILRQTVRESENQKETIKQLSDSVSCIQEENNKLLTTIHGLKSDHLQTVQELKGKIATVEKNLSVLSENVKY